MLQIAIAQSLEARRRAGPDAAMRARPGGRSTDREKSRAAPGAPPRRPFGSR
ncbi:serine dehydratase [Burkholderia thailandensis]|nr:serine dehydratase [Burkholderia thailandensis]AOI51165.1 serine dehydratase [Burkholderia thailandensis]AOJ50189.1 serine dehydratase [Burkholderia thailandensis]AOJ57586.1 serine dehydratase [Burkholderia thailandensis]KXF61527.1 serine dehydratase [Burkholderia thailandensis]